MVEGKQQKFGGGDGSGDGGKTYKCGGGGEKTIEMWSPIKIQGIHRPKIH